MLTTDGVLSFAVMNYAEIGLEEEEFYGWGYVGVYSRKTYRHPNSNRPAIVHIADEPGNTGQLGQWVFRTDDLNAATTTTTTTGTPTGGATATTYTYIIVWYIVCVVKCGIK